MANPLCRSIGCVALCLWASAGAALAQQAAHTGAAPTASGTAEDGANTTPQQATDRIDREALALNSTPTPAVQARRDGVPEDAGETAAPAVANDRMPGDARPGGTAIQPGVAAPKSGLRTAVPNGRRPSTSPDEAAPTPQKADDKLPVGLREGSRDQ